MATIKFLIQSKSDTAGIYVRLKEGRLIDVKAKTKFVANGKITDKNKLVDFLPIENHATNQGTEREILWRKLYLKNVRKIAVNGELYKVIAE